MSPPYGGDTPIDQFIPALRRLQGCNDAASVRSFLGIKKTRDREVAGDDEREPAVEGLVIERAQGEPVR
jgi:hypothetical protein